MKFLHKVLKSESPSYLLNTIYQIVVRNVKREITSSFVKHDYFKNSFFPSAITVWSKLDCYISSADSFEVFKKTYFKLY